MSDEQPMAVNLQPTINLDDLGHTEQLDSRQLTGGLTMMAKGRKVTSCMAKGSLTPQFHFVTQEG